MTLTYLFIGLTVLTSLAAFQSEKVFKALIMNPYAIKSQHQYYRFLTSGFIHANYTHLGFNMFSFYFFGSSVEYIFSVVFGDAGGPSFVALYLLAILASDIPTYLKQKNNPEYNSLGASGGVAAVIFAFILFQPLQKICIFIAFCLPGFIMGIIFVVFSYYQDRRSQDNINHSAHLYGALFGWLFCLILAPSSWNSFLDQIKSWNPF
jgi:membrane associated rhomboid family serine protease